MPFVREAARELGFARIGVAPAGPVSHAEDFRRWLSEGRHAGLGYMARNVEKRLCPAKLVDGARSVICLAVSYAPFDESGGASVDALARERLAFVARYARGQDYHRVVKSRGHALMDRIRAIEPTFCGRAFVDSAPVAERSLAARAGLGWIGRNGCLIVPGLGSYVLLCEIISNLELRVGKPLPALCGGCDACVRACPAGALLGNGRLDARRCLSCLTIEHEGNIPNAFRQALGPRVFGCDTCQEACPHNRDLAAGDPELAVCRTPLHRLPLWELLAWKETDWDRATRGSATRRARYDKLIANAALAAGACMAGGLPQEQSARLLAPLKRLAEAGPCRDEAAWALAQWK